MNLEDQALDQFKGTHFGLQEDVPRSKGILTTGILSIVFFFGLIGLILSIVTLVRASGCRTMYNSNPTSYTDSSIKKVNTARTCAIVSVSLLLTVIIVMAIIIPQLN